MECKDKGSVGYDACPIVRAIDHLVSVGAALVTAQAGAAKIASQNVSLAICVLRILFAIRSTYE